MHGNTTRDRLNEEAAQREMIRAREKKTERLLSLTTLGRQPFVLFQHWEKEIWFGQSDVLRHFQTFEELVRFLLCLVGETADAIKRKELAAAAVPHFAVECIIHGLVCQLEIESVFQLARDLGFISAEGNLQDLDVVPSPWQIDLSFLAVATATKGIARADRSITSETPKLHEEWAAAIETRLEALKKK